MLDTIVGKHATTCNEVGQEGTANVAQGVLVQTSPRSMGSAKENRLCLNQWMVAVKDATVWKTLRGQPQAPGALHHAGGQYRLEACAPLRDSSWMRMSRGKPADEVCEDSLDLYVSTTYGRARVNDLGSRSL